MRPRADLRGEPDALALAARQRAGGAREREIFEPDVDQEFQPLADFLEHARRRSRSAFAVSRLGSSVNHSPAPLTDRSETSPMCLPPIFTHSASGLRRIAVAGVAGDVGEVARHLLARPVALGLAPAPLQIGDHALERLLRLVGAHAVVVGELDVVLAGAVEDRVLRLLRQVLPLGVEREAVVLAERGQRLHVIGRRRFRPRRDRALAQRRVLVGDDEVGIDVLLDAEAAAFRAGAERIVEREQPRLDLRNGEAGHRAGEFLGEDQALGGLVALLVGLGAGRRPHCRRAPRTASPSASLSACSSESASRVGDVGPHHERGRPPRRCRG